MKTITLSVKERILLSTILHDMDGRRIEAIILQSLVTRFNFTPQEISQLSLTDGEGGQITWDPKTATDASFDITDEQAAMLLKSMVKLDETGKMRIDLLSLDAKIRGMS